MPQWQSWLIDLADIVGKEHVSTREADLAAGSLADDAANRPRAVVWPGKLEEVAELLRFTRKQKIPVISVGAGAARGRGPMMIRGGLALDLKRMNRVRQVNKVNLTCEVEAGVTGEHLEKALAEKSLTLGQMSSALAETTVGAWLAGRAGNQFSSLSGPISDLLISLEGALPDGSVFRSRATPRSAAGPDLDQMIVGSEGTLAVITAAVFAVARQPALRLWRRFRLADLSSGLSALRLVLQKGLDPVAARLHDQASTRQEAAALKLEPGGCLLVLGFEGPTPELTKLKAELASRLVQEQGGEDLDEELGVEGLQQRDAAGNHPSPARSEGFSILETLEFSTTWSNLLPLYQAVLEAVPPGAQSSAFFTNAYREGCSIAFAFAAQAGGMNALELRREILDRAVAAGVQCRAAVCHPDLGLLHAPLLHAQHGATLPIYQGLKHYLDPNLLLNPSQTG